MKLASHLWQSRHGVYYIRHVFNGREYRRSLQTKNPLIARNLAYRLGGMDPKEIIKKLQSGDLKQYSIELNRKEGLKIETDGTSHDHQNLMQALASPNLLEALKAINASLPLPSQADGLETSPNIESSIQQSIEDYLKDRLNGGIKTRTHASWKSSFNKFAKVIGPKTPVSQITADVYRKQWRNQYVDHLAPKTQNSIYSQFHGLFDWCIKQHRCLKNPVNKLQMTREAKKKRIAETSRERLPYDNDDIALLFSKEARAAIKKPCLFWMPLIALYTGARAEEIVRIHLDSFHEFSPNLWRVKIDDSKTESGIRSLPLHPKLIELGLLRYREDLLNANPDAQRLFPYMKEVRGRLAHRFSQDYGAFKKSLGLSVNKDFHSFRTTTIGILKIKNVPYDKRTQFVGHEGQRKQDTHDDNYASKTLFSDQQLADSIFPALDYYNEFVVADPYQKIRFSKYMSNS